MKADTKPTSITTPASRDKVRSSTSATGAELKAAAELFQQIVYLIDTLRTMGSLTVQAMGNAEPGDDTAMHYAITMEQLATQIGAIADHGGNLCGNGYSVGDFDEWLLSPAARSALQAAAAARSPAAA